MSARWLALLAAMSATCSLVDSSEAVPQCDILDKFGVKFVMPQGKKEKECFALLPSGNKTWSDELCRRLTASAGSLFTFSQPRKDSPIVEALGLNKLKGLVWTPAVVTSQGRWAYPDRTPLSTALEAKSDLCLAIFFPQRNTSSSSSSSHSSFKYSTRLCWREFPAVCRVSPEKTRWIVPIRSDDEDEVALGAANSFALLMGGLGMGRAKPKESKADDVAFVIKEGQETPSEVISLEELPDSETMARSSLDSVQDDLPE